MSERDLHVDTAAAFDAAVVYPALFLEGEFATGTGRWWTGLGEFAWNGQTWLGLGGLVAVSRIEESTDVKARGFSVRLSGQSSANLSLALQSCRQGAAGRIWLGALTAAGALVGDPVLIAQGKLDVPSGEDDGETASITISYEDRLIDLERPREYRYTSESQRLFYPDDKGFEFVPRLQDAVDLWYPKQ